MDKASVGVSHLLTGCVYTPVTESDLLIRNRMADKYKECKSNGSLSEWAQTALVLKFSPLNSKA